jgi:tetratricopeptide (TPR) repeat protein
MRLKAEILILIIMMILPGILRAGSHHQDAADLFTKANQMYIEQNYAGSIEAYEKIISDNKISSEVYFNLGNAYYKTGDMTRAILNYERAKRIKPSDPDITHNLKIAYLGTIDKIEPLPRVFYEEWWDKFVYEGSVDKRAVIALILVWLAILTGAVYLFSSRPAVRKSTFFSGLMFLFIGLFTWYLTSLQKAHLTNHQGAVIFAESTYVKSSPDAKSSNLFLLHSGTRVEVLDELQGWKKIRIANGNEGWIESGSVEII